ncbi:MAG: hypothetical protein JWQ74_781 [Marmoricola sp.]|nr:hypothetical protein [Marmoricola sp.]
MYRARLLFSVDDMSRIVAAVLLVLYSVFIARLTLTEPSTSSWLFSLADHLATSASNGRLQWAQTEVLANIALFVPAGFLLAIALNSAVASAVLCVAASALIEYAQLRYLPLRVPSGADVLHNGYGAALGALCALPFTLVVGARRRTAQLT